MNVIYIGYLMKHFVQFQSATQPMPQIKVEQMSAPLPMPTRPPVGPLPVKVMVITYRLERLYVL